MKGLYISVKLGCILSSLLQNGIQKQHYRISNKPCSAKLELDTFVNSFPNKPLFLCVCSTSLSKTLWIKEIVCNNQFLLFPRHFLPFQRILHHFLQISNCFLQTLSVWKNLKFVVCVET